MPKISRYFAKTGIPGESGNVQMDPNAASVAGRAIANAGAGLERFANELIERHERLKRQREDSELIEAGSKINSDILDYRLQFEKNNKGIQAADSIPKADEYLTGLVERYRRPDASDRYNKSVQSHIISFGNSLKSHLATYEAAQMKDYASDVRSLDLESSKKLAQSGDYETAVVNYRKTLEAQKGNGSLSPTDYEIATINGKSDIAEAYITSLLSTDPVSAKTAYDTLKTESLTSSARDRLGKTINPAVTRQKGTAIGTEIFKGDSTGSLESMTDAIRARKLDPETEKIAVGQIKELYHERQLDKDRLRKDAIDKVNSILVPISLQRNGLNRPTDLSPAQWSELTQAAPEYAQRLQDSMRKEVDAQVRMNRAEAAQAEQMTRMRWKERESELLISPDLATKNLKEELSLRRIGPTEYRSLLSAQEKMDPIKRDSVRSALNKINQGEALARSLKLPKGKDKAQELANWRLKYTELVTAFTYNHADDPDFDRKLNDFMERSVLSDMATSVFKSRETERTERLQAVKEEAGPMTKRVGGKRAIGSYSQEDLEYTAKKHGLTIDQVKQRLGVK